MIRRVFPVHYRHHIISRHHHRLDIKLYGMLLHHGFRVSRWERMDFNALELTIFLQNNKKGDYCNNGRLDNILVFVFPMIQGNPIFISGAVSRSMLASYSSTKTSRVGNFISVSWRFSLQTILIAMTPPAFLFFLFLSCSSSYR